MNRGLCLVTKQKPQFYCQCNEILSATKENPIILKTLSVTLEFNGWVKVNLELKRKIRFKKIEFKYCTIGIHE